MSDPILRIRDLCKSFGALEVSDDVNLDLRAGEIHAVIGPNGAGKSTLVAQICGGVAPDRGRIMFRGRDVTALGVADRARMGLARTFQISALAGESSIVENLALARIGARGGRPEWWRRAIDADTRDRCGLVLDRVGLAPQPGLRVAELSHGARRQLELAMALMIGPHALILDEPLAGLDGDAAASMIALLGELRPEAPILLVEHDMDAVFALADRISVLVAGRVIATGSVAEVRGDPAVQAAYLGEGS